MLILKCSDCFMPAEIVWLGAFALLRHILQMAFTKRLPNCTPCIHMKNIVFVPPKCDQIIRLTTGEYLLDCAYGLWIHHQGRHHKRTSRYSPIFFPRHRQILISPGNQGPETCMSSLILQSKAGQHFLCEVCSI